MSLEAVVRRQMERLGWLTRWDEICCERGTVGHIRAPGVQPLTFGRNFHAFVCARSDSSEPGRMRVHNVVTNPRRDRPILLRFPNLLDTVDEWRRPRMPQLLVPNPSVLIAETYTIAHACFIEDKAYLFGNLKANWIKEFECALSYFSYDSGQPPTTSEPSGSRSDEGTVRLGQILLQGAFDSSSVSGLLHQVNRGSRLAVSHRDLDEVLRGVVRVLREHQRRPKAFSASDLLRECVKARRRDPTDWEQRLNTLLAAARRFLERHDYRCFEERVRRPRALLRQMGEAFHGHRVPLLRPARGYVRKLQEAARDELVQARQRIVASLRETGAVPEEGTLFLLLIEFLIHQRP